MWICCLFYIDSCNNLFNLIFNCLFTEDTDRISPHLVQLAKAERSTDNISVIVVFLREPSKIAAEAHWANRNCPTSEMETSLDNANNPFSLSNGASNDIDNVITTPKGDGLMLNLTDNFKQNGKCLILISMKVVFQECTFKYIKINNYITIRVQQIFIIIYLWM